MATRQSYHYGTGRRKSSTARVILTSGTGEITVNKKSLDEYFGRETARMIVRQPLGPAHWPEPDCETGHPCSRRTLSNCA